MKSVPSSSNTSSNTANFPNSLSHRQHIRTWMSLLCAFPMLSASEFASRLPLLWRALDAERIPSTRLFIEWFILLGLLKHHHHHEHHQDDLLASLIARLSEYGMPTGSAVSAMTIALHFGRHCSVVNGKEYYFSIIFDELLPWITHNNHTVRLYAIFVFTELAKHSATEFSRGYGRLVGWVEGSEASQRFLDKIRKEYFIGDFDPLNHYDLNTIFNVFPYRTSVVSLDECILPGSFAHLGNINIPLGDEDQEEDQEVEDQISAEQIGNIPQIYQQKINPWNMDLLDNDLRLNEQQRSIKKSNDFDMIMIASLIDRTPNLAGLSRTCEIFGATSLYLPSLSLSTTPDFKAISMTSECWLPLHECTPSNLPTLISRLKEEGYRVVAVEQSNDSVMLTEYRFGGKCAVLLGGEREGIPVELLQLVDDCVEIPQYGHIRSLNVHVTGSLILWEARRQLLK